MCESNNIFLANIFPSALQTKIQVRVNNPQKKSLIAKHKVYFCYFFRFFLFGKKWWSNQSNKRFHIFTQIKLNQWKLRKTEFFSGFSEKRSLRNLGELLIFLLRRSSRVCRISITKNLHTCCFSEDSVEDTIKKNKDNPERIKRVYIQKDFLVIGPWVTWRGEFVFFFVFPK